MSGDLDSDLFARADKRWIPRSGMGVLRLALLFGTGAMALTLVLVPILDRQASDRAVAAAPALDLMSTGSIGSGGGNYTIRRSVLQSEPNAVCIIRDTGQFAGDC